MAEVPQPSKPKIEEKKKPRKEVMVQGKKEVFYEDKSAKKSKEELGDGDLFLDTIDEFTEIQLEDYTWKVNSRKTYGKVLIGLLIVQNLFVFSLVGSALYLEALVDLQLVFGILVAATLTETAYMVKVIVEWLFKDINYPQG